MKTELAPTRFIGSRFRLCLASLLLAVLACTAQTQAPPQVQEPLPREHHHAHLQAYRHHVDALKEAYLKCEQAAATSLLTGPKAMQCSEVYERLKTVAFAGRYDALQLWWRSERDGER
jgi:hypothetical protein